MIENINKLEGIIDSELKLKLQAAAARHLEQSNMTFNIEAVSEHTIGVVVSQNETPSGKYATEATLIKRTQDLFKKTLPGVKVEVTAQTHLPSPANLVNADWIEKKMQERGVRIKQIAFDTGIDRDSISDWVTGKRSMSQIVKALFYFYLSR